MIPHLSDCPIHDAPAQKPGLCNCGADDYERIQTMEEEIRRWRLNIIDTGRRVNVARMQFMVKFPDRIGEMLEVDLPTI